MKKKDKGINHEKISSRKIKQEKKERRDLAQTQLQEQSQIILQQQIALSLNQEYLNNYSQVGTRRKSTYLHHINSKNEKVGSTSKKTNFVGLIPRMVKQIGRFRKKFSPLFVGIKKS
ncbi:MAG: hypothetical protein ACW98F_02290 [Candidatus Hodarchaeales archaeon]